MHPKPCFPFTHIEGQDAFKLGLILNAIDANIGGLLVIGPRGTAKSTLARSFAQLLGESVPFVNLPLGVTEEMLLGTLDLQQVLSDQKVRFQPGLLSKAHGGVLYVDEVNLLADHLVDLLLDVSASGVNHLERDGITRQHESVFLLLGTMNPEEGKLRPQLEDRFGLAVQVENPLDISTRTAIVSKRLSFDEDPSAYLIHATQDQARLKQKIQAARDLLAAVSVPDWAREEIARACIAAKVDGLRADLIWTRAARAHAAWCDRSQVTQDDLKQVRTLVLLHRQGVQDQDLDPTNSAKPGGSEDGVSSESEISESEIYDAAPMPQPLAESAKTQPSPMASAQHFEGQWGQMPASLPFKPMVTQEAIVKQPQQKIVAQISLELGKRARTGWMVPGRAVYWFKTLAKHARSPCAGPIQSLFFRREKRIKPIFHLVILDHSASSAMKNALNLAKSCLLELIHWVKSRGEKIALITFGGEVKLCWDGQKPNDKLRRQILSIAPGGGTPLAQVLCFAESYIKGKSAFKSQYNLVTYMLTDGRVAHLPQRQPWAGEKFLLDVENTGLKLSRCAEIATRLEACYLKIR